MGALSDNTPKPLIPVSGRYGALELNLQALASLDAGIAVTVVTGYRAESFLRVAEEAKPLPVSLVHNEDWQSYGPVRSMILGLQDNLDDVVVLANGDTVFDPSLLELIGKASAPGVTLLASATALSEHDEVVVDLDGDHVLLAAKRPNAIENATISAGLVSVRGRPAQEAMLAHLSALFDQEAESGRPAIWHSVFQRLSAAGTPASVNLVPREQWQEFDSEYNIVDFKNRAAR
jgi:choline kinase